MEPTSQCPVLSMENRPFKRRKDSPGRSEGKDIDSPGKGLGATDFQIKEGIKSKLDQCLTESYENVGCPFYPHVILW